VHRIRVGRPKLANGEQWIVLQKLRNMLLGGGKPANERRRLPRPGPRPNVGASVVRGRALIKLTDPISQEFWEWMVLAGWREVRMSKNKRRYEPMPADTLRKLMRSPPQEWEAIHQDMFGPSTR
jgi:hypothetical protein